MDILAILIIGLSWVHLWQPTPVFCLENSMDREDWQATAHGSQRAGYNCVTENIYIFTHTHIYTYIYIFGVSLVAQRLKHLPAMQETWVQSLGQEDPLEKEMATHSSILAWRIPWTEEPGGLQPMGSQRVGHDWATSLSHTYFIFYICIYIFSIYKHLACRRSSEND